MKLPNFENSTLFNKLRKDMGDVELIFWQSSLVWVDPDFENWKNGLIDIEVNIEEISIAEDWSLEYKGNKTILYIRDQIIYKNSRYDNPREYKYHISWCRTLEDMKRKGRFKSRYFVSRRVDGIFKVNLIDGEEIVESNKLVEMEVCKNCLDKLSYKGYSHKGKYIERINIYNDFKISEFLESFGSKIYTVPPNDVDTAPINVYTNDFNQISIDYRKSQNWKCEQCGKDLRDNNKNLHTHHIDGNKSNNKYSNLQALCIECHSKQPNHSQMNNSFLKSKRKTIDQKPKPLIEKLILPDIDCGNKYRDSGDYDSAIMCYEGFINKHPNIAVGYIRLGNVYEKKGQYDYRNKYYKIAADLGDKGARSFLNNLLKEDK
jgi:tetratricopeptide (TPR) repeat protein